MKTPRLSFGVALTRDKSYVVVSGGLTTGFLPTQETEVYNVEKNVWAKAPKMIQARNAHSLCEVGNGQYLYAFGG